MHKWDIIHRDLKLDNILITKIEEEGSLNVKIADFGIGTFLARNDIICNK